MSGLIFDLEWLKRVLDHPEETATFAAVKAVARDRTQGYAKMILPYTGNSAYCYANSIHMALCGNGANPAILPDPGFIECLTTMPFGKCYMRLPTGPSMAFRPADLYPEIGIARALDTLGWTCQRAYSSSPAEAFAKLRDELEYGPCLLGPVEMGYLTYNPTMNNHPVGDHYVLALAADKDTLILHDPAGFPYVRVANEDFEQAWEASTIPYKRGTYSFRSQFMKIRDSTRADMLQATWRLIADRERDIITGPVLFGGSHAVRAFAADLRRADASRLRNHLVSFSLPLGARRLLDASRFAEEAGLGEVAGNLERQAHIVGGALGLAVQKRWADLAAAMDVLATTEQEFEALY